MVRGERREARLEEDALKNSGVPLSSFNERTQAQILAQLHPGDLILGKARNSAKKGGIVEIVPLAAQASERRLRQVQGAKLNKTEAEFLDRLRAEQPKSTIRTQSLTLLLANGCRYTPDFFVDPMIGTDPDIENSFKAEAYEVKGFMREDAAVKIKVAAAAYPWIRFFLVWKRTRKAGGGWGSQEILA